MNYLGSKELVTERLLLHKTEEKDLKVLWEILLLEEVSKRYLTSIIHDDWEQEKKWQYKKLSRAGNKDVFTWTIELQKTHEVIGQVDVMPTEKEEIRDIGWFISPPYQKKGYCFEATQEILKYMFIEVGIKKIETCVSKYNKASYRLMEKLGFKKQNTTRKVKYTLLDHEEDCIEYHLTKEDFLKELFRRDELYITIDIDKDPYIKHISDDAIINLTGESGSGKTTETLKYKDDSNFIIVDTDNLSHELKEYFIKKYQKIPDIINEFDTIYKGILDYYKTSNKTIIIDSAQFRNLKDLSLLRGEIIILRTCINNCFSRCLERLQRTKKVSYEEEAAYITRKKGMYSWYHSLNNFIDRVDRI